MRFLVLVSLELVTRYTASRQRQRERPAERELKGGRGKVYGYSPGCLLVSIVLSVFLTLAVNGCLHLVD
jgi:hypothetical protein